MSDILSDLAYLHGAPTVTATIKAQPEHFVVKEQLGFEFTGSGEHLMLKVRKRGENTSFVANELAKVCGVKSKDVSWAGLKDRHAVTEQWLSVHLPKGETPDFSEFERRYPHVQILATDRHNKKLRPGDLTGNAFELTLSAVSDTDAVLARIALVLESGVPNYFGAQRFGRDGNNLDEARRWGRENVRTRNQNKRSLYLSTARSWIFNHIVSSRLQQGQFDRLLAGDVVRCADGERLVEEQTLAADQQALERGSVALTAALAGDNALPTQGEAQALEQAAVDAEPDLMGLIRGNRMRHDRRELLLKTPELSYVVEGDSITLHFSLSAGCFATALLREIVIAQEAQREYS
jgi:tRNA pseudouridine13 synthase